MLRSSNLILAEQSFALLPYLAHPLDLFRHRCRRATLPFKMIVGKLEPVGTRGCVARLLRRPVDGQLTGVSVEPGGPD